MKFLGVQPYIEVMHSQFHVAKFLGMQQVSMKCSYYSLFVLFLGIHIKMQSDESGGTFVRHRYFHRPRANSFRQFTMFSTICIYINCTAANLFLKTKKTTNHHNVQRVQWQTLHYLIQLHLLSNALTSCSTCAHQKKTDAILTILMTNMQGRILKEKQIDTNEMRQGRSCSIQMLINLKIVSNVQFLVIHFFC